MRSLSRYKRGNDWWLEIEDDEGTVRLLGPNSRREARILYGELSAMLMEELKVERARVQTRPHEEGREIISAG